jgi:hypothetical protein
LKADRVEAATRGSGSAEADPEGLMATDETDPPDDIPGLPPELEGIVARAQAGDEGVMPQLCALLDRHPVLWESVGDLANRAEVALLQHLAGRDLFAHEATRRKLAALRAQFIPTAKHFTSWLGLCPQHQGSAGKIRSRRVRRGGNRAGRALRLAAQSCYHAQHALGAFYRRIQARAGAPKAIGATARKLAERIYRLLRYGEGYVRPGIEAYEAAYRERVVRGLARRAAELGYRLERSEVTEGTAAKT